MSAASKILNFGASGSGVRAISGSKFVFLNFFSGDIGLFNIANLKVRMYDRY